MAQTHGTGRVALVTGAGRGIGRATALMLAARGDRVMGVARSEEELAALAREAPIETFAGSVATQEGCERIVEADPRAPRADRRPREQRRDRQLPRAGDLGTGSRGLAGLPRGQPRCRVPPDPPLRTGHDRRRMGPDRDRELHRRPGRRTGLVGLHGGQARGDRADALGRAGPDPARGHVQRRVSRMGEDRDGRRRRGDGGAGDRADGRRGVGSARALLCGGARDATPRRSPT